jgi:hypothetical protein
MFFGAINYFPNVDGVLFFAREAGPLLAATHPRARLKIVGQHPTPEILAFAGSTRRGYGSGRRSPATPGTEHPPRRHSPRPRDRGGSVFDDSELALEMGREGRALVEMRYPWDATAKRLQGFFGEILSG